MIENARTDRPLRRANQGLRTLVLALLSGLHLTASAADKKTSPEAFIQSVYARYQNLEPGTHPPYLVSKPLRHSYFSQRFIKALERDQRCTPEGEMGALSADIFIAAQDFGERGIGPIKIKAIGQNRFTIQFDVFPEAPPPERSPSKVTLQLVMQNGEWRIGDVDQALQTLESAPCTLDQGQR